MQEEKPSADQHHSIKLMMWVGFWVLLLVFAAVFFQRFLNNDQNPNRSPETRYSDNGKEVVLQRNRYGHYNLTGYINGAEVEFLVDTGATDISIPAHVASRIGLQRLHEMSFDTANGVAKGYATHINRVRVGSIELTELDASINPNVDDDTVLLGMSFLKRIEFTQRGDTLILRQYN